MNLRGSFHYSCDPGAAWGGIGLGGTRPQSLSPGTYLDLRKASSSGSCTVGRKLLIRKNHRKYRKKSPRAVDVESPPMTEQLLPPACKWWQGKVVCWAEARG